VRKVYTLTEEKNPRYFISWGLGVQSTTLGVLSAIGKIRKVDGLIFADPQWEHKETYQVFDWYSKWFVERDINVYKVTAGNIRTDKDRDHSDLPLWYGSGGAPLRRQCTVHYKIDPIRRKIREIIGLRQDGHGRTKRNSVYMYLGISTDEAQRMADADVTWIKNEYPLVDMNMSRSDCIRLLKELGLPVPPKSACIGCPYTSAVRWKDLKERSPDEFQQAVEFDNKIRTPPERMIQRGFNEQLYLFSKKEPLETADFDKYIKEDPKGDMCDSGYCFI